MLLSQGDNLKPPIIYSRHVARTLDIHLGTIHEILQLFCEASSLAVLQVSQAGLRQGLVKGRGYSRWQEQSDGTKHINSRRECPRHKRECSAFLLCLHVQTFADARARMQFDKAICCPC
ncbi:hypothetical protein E2C01_086588 [Portunus trituberculatus]|uniref:Uncharacterized protein n=1 Tax=Portunus trituberculatus TaxID=210409 RepID=A0A5B7JAR2_PORTR|nr:hypothetical protein [Portunus trituberculatus]